MNTATFFSTPCAVTLAALALAGCGGGSGGAGGSTTPPGTAAKEATAVLEAKSGSTVAGTVSFVAKGDKVDFKIDITGAPPGDHAVHIHEKGDCSAPDAMSAGDHWNPTSEPHGKWEHAPYHLGDVGNIQVGDDGRGSMSMSTDKWTLGTGAMDDVAGHSIVVHAQPDDFTTQPAGAAGARLACGVIRVPK